MTTTTSISLLIHGLSLDQHIGFTAPLAMGVLAAVRALLTAFVLNQRRSARPLFLLRIVMRGPVADA